MGIDGGYGLDDLVCVMRRLRKDCPWDREQTHQSITENLREECEEVCEAIALADDRLLCEELGDVLLQVVFHALIAQERGAFSLEDVCRGLTDKLVRRHPHVFGDVKAENVEQALLSWEEVKRRERGA